MHHIVSLSGGTASAVAAERVIERYGREAVTLWFADTSWEDEDLHRFKAELMARWGGELVDYCDGRTPLEVAEDVKLIPNQRRAPCSRILKIEPFHRYLRQVEKPVTVHLGLDYTEVDRMDAPKENYEQVDGVTVDFPLMWKPYEFRTYNDVVKTWGIEPPRLYDKGFSHNNCGGRCIRQGIREWLRLKYHFPERFAEVRDWEQAQRAIGDARSEYAILRDQSNGTVTPLTLAELEEREEPDPGEPIQEDLFACFCSY